MSQALEAVAGVVDADVSYDAKTAEVEYDPSVVDAAQLVEVVNATGFRARLANEEPRETSASGAPSDATRRD